MRLPSRVAAAVAVVAAVSLSCLSAPAVAAPLPPDQDPFYVYDGSAPLKDVAPGTVLKTRTGTATLPDIPLPVQMVQLLYRTRDQLGRPVATATSILKPPTPLPTPRLLSYQSFYDALTTRCQPSYTLNGGPTNGTWSSEQHLVSAYLLQGFTLVVSDFESQKPAFATGPIYGYETLDGIRAAYNSTDVGLPASTKVAMSGYSGGAIATNWASELAPAYAPDVNDKMLGAAMGGVFVHPIHNLHYVDGSDTWAAVMPLAIVGIAKAFEIDFSKYLSPYGQQVLDLIKNDCIGEHPLPNLRFAQLVKPQYANPEAIPELVTTANELIMGTGGEPSIPMMIRQGTDGTTDEGTQPSPVYGPGDGVMLAGDVRSLARKYCGYGLAIDYAEKPLGHGRQGLSFLVESIPWLQGLWLGTPPPNNCSSIAAGNSLEPTTVPSTLPPGNSEGVTYFPTGSPNNSCGGRPATFVGTSGNDTIIGTSGDDVIAGLSGNDRVEAGEGNDVVCGASGNDALSGGPGNDHLDGSSGNDSLMGGTGADILGGGFGFDLVYYRDHTTGVTAQIDGKPTSGNGTDGPAGARDLLSLGVDGIVGGPGADGLVGGTGNDRLYGGGGNDKLWGMSGNDHLNGEAGADTYRGGDGNDVLAAKDGRADTLMDGGTGKNVAFIDRSDPTPRNAAIRY